jgi:hypothetical protein
VVGRFLQGKDAEPDSHPFLIEKHKQTHIAAGHMVAVNRELSALSAVFTRSIEWGKFEGPNPKRKVKKVKEALTRLEFLSEDEGELG